MIPLLAGLLSLPIPEQRYAPLHLTPQQQKQQTLDVLVAWLLAEAERQPVLAVWEDLHWADPSTLEFLGFVLEQTPTVPMLHVLTFRPAFSPPWPMCSHMTPLTLNRLERPQVQAMITQLTRGKALPQDVVQHIVGKTDGVPLYVEELTKMLLESGLLREEAACYVLTRPLSEITIPATLRDALMARLDRVQQAKEVAQFAAIVGREFPYDLLRAITPHDEATLQNGLAQLVEAELLYQRGRPPHARYLFKHALIQDAAYASLLRSMRQQVHQRIAQVLEEQFPETVETQPELLARHYTEAGQHARALDYWQQAGQRARTRSAHMEAVAHLSAGLDVLPRLPDTPARRHQELALYLPLGASLLVTKGNGSAEVEQAYLRARELCEQLVETTQLARVLFALNGFYINRAEYGCAQKMATHLLDLAQRIDDPISLLVGHHALDMTLFFQGEFAAAHDHLARAIMLDTSQRAQSMSLAVALVARTATYFYVALVLWMLGYPEHARQRGSAALTLARQHDNPFNLAAAHHFVALVHHLRREPDTVRELLKASLALSAEHGFLYWSALGTTLRGWALVFQGEHEAGIAQIHQGMAAYNSIGSESTRPFMLGLLAEAYGRAAQYPAGLEALAEALALTAQTGEGIATAELYRLRGELVLAQASTRHQWEEAEGSLQQALAIARQQQAKSWELRAAMSLARLWQRQGKRREALELLAPVYAWFTEGFDTADLQEARALLDTLA